MLSVVRAVLVGCLLGSSGAPSTTTVSGQCPQSPFRRAKPLVIAHASSTYFGPPNTIAMMRAAVAAGADAVDVDLRVTADGQLVAAHDDDLSGTTGVSGSIAKQSLAQLRTLDAGYAWTDHRGGHSARGKGITVATVEEVLVAFPKRQISIEFKTTGGEQKLCDLLRRTGRTKDVHVGSAGDAAVDRFEPICPEVVTTVTDAMVPVLLDAQRTGRAWCAPVPIGQPPYYRSNGAVLSAESVRWNHAHGLAVYTWTVDDPGDLAAVARAGVDGVYTGRADIARKLFDKSALPVGRAPVVRRKNTGGVEVHDLPDRNRVDARVDPYGILQTDH